MFAAANQMGKEASWQQFLYKPRRIVMKYLILGTGLQGRVVGYDILKFETDAEIIFADIDKNNLETARKLVLDPRTTFVEFDIYDTKETVALMLKSDVIIVCLPHDGNTTDAVYKALAGAEGRKAVFSDYWLWPRHHAHHEALCRGKVLAVPGMGIAPGFANVCVGQLAHEFDQLEEATMYVCGLPVDKGVHALDYMEAFNLEAMLDMYITPATVYEDGKVTKKPNLTVFDNLIIPGHGMAEVFWTDGLCTLEKNMKEKGVRKIAECTLRWPGHIAKMRELEALGYFSTEEIDVNGVKVRPKDVSEKIFQKLWAKKSGFRDLTYLYVVGKGELNGKFVEKSYELKTYSDEEAGITSMEMATAYPISVAAMMVAKDHTGRVGIIDPELYFIGDKFHEMVAELGKRGIAVYEK